MSYQRHKEYNLIYMQRQREAVRTARLLKDGKCPNCEMLLKEKHDCDKTIMPGWTLIVAQHGAWDGYFHFFEMESSNGGMFYHRSPRKGFEYLENCHGTIEDVKRLIEQHRLLTQRI